MDNFSLNQLVDIIDLRSSADAESSYTKSLLDAGVSRCAKKFGEEATELVIASIQADKVDVKNEAADVLYHFFVLLKASGVSLDMVLGELETRTAQSGHQEKASRKS